jgi:predicted DNA-binding transcriptional regulator AlpA
MPRDPSRIASVRLFFSGNLQIVEILGHVRTENADEGVGAIFACPRGGSEMGAITVRVGEWPVDNIVELEDRNDLASVIMLMWAGAQAARRRSLAKPATTQGAPVQYPPEAGDRLASYDHAITAEVLAPILGVSPQMIYKRAAGGSLPCFHIGKAVKFCPATVVTTLALPTTHDAPPTIVARLAGFGRAMNAGEVAYILGVAPKTIYRHAEAGTLPSFPIGTRRLFYQSTMARHIATMLEARGGERLGSLPKM